LASSYAANISAAILTVFVITWRKDIACYTGCVLYLSRAGSVYWTKLAIRSLWLTLFKSIDPMPGNSPRKFYPAQKVLEFHVRCNMYALNLQRGDKGDTVWLLDRNLFLLNSSFLLIHVQVYSYMPMF
jgi:hypothetical protein